MSIRVAIVMGGFTDEHDISLQSGETVITHLDKAKYTPYRIIIDKHKWYHLTENNTHIEVDKNDFSIILERERIHFKVVFNTIHGSPGEDGRLQAYFDFIGMPYTSCGFYASALTYNKRDTLSVLKTQNIRTATSYQLNRGEVIDVEKIIETVGLPCFIKPNSGGSSIGISKVNHIDNIADALEKAFLVDEELIIETALQGTEVTVGVITYQGKVRSLPVTEIVPDASNDFFDYDAKYHGHSQEITPARISKTMQTLLSQSSINIYQSLKMKGYMRCEYIIVNDLPHLLEVNTTPGLTEASILPQQAQCEEISLSALFDDTINHTLKTHINQ